MYSLSLQIPEYVSEIIKQLNTAGFEAYVVGGCVRDALLGRIPNDWDICTSALPEEIIKNLTGYKIVKTGIAHGTVTAIKNTNICEITTFRTDGDYSDHRRPDTVYFTRNISADLSRRDFTVNAMAFSKETGIIDLFGGKKDLESKMIRCVGQPTTRFTEDSLRILRALRFSSVLEFEIESLTESAIFYCCNLLHHVARERVYNELKLLLCGNFAYKIFHNYKKVFMQFLTYPQIAENSCMLFDAPCYAPLRLALLFSEASKDEILSDLLSLKADKKTINEVLFLTENSSLAFFNDRTSVRKTLSAFGKEKSKLLLEYIGITHKLSLHEKKHIEALISETPVITLKELEITGHDVIELGFKEGRKVKEALNFALNGVLSDKCKNTKRSLIDYLNTHITTE